MLWITIEMEYKIKCLKFILFFTNGRQKLTAKGLRVSLKVSLLRVSLSRVSLSRVVIIKSVIIKSVIIKRVTIKSVIIKSHY